MRALGFICLAAIAIAGCALDQGANGNNRCNVANPVECTASQHCDRGFCVEGGGIDADIHGDAGFDGAPPDTASDGGHDGGVDANTDGGDWCDGATGACTTSEPGVCNPGHHACGPSGSICVHDVAPSSEICNGHDEDCDGRTDEEAATQCYPPTAARGCTMSAGAYTCAGICRPGVAACAGGSLGTCTGAITPMSNESCQGPTETGIDENCDGAIDEGCSCTNGAMRSCFTGAPSMAGVGVCMNGMQMCAGGHWGTCTGAGSPTAETCGNQGLDNDCDGTPDNIPGRGAPCTLPPPIVGVCAMGTMECNGGMLRCTGPTAAASEVCDMRDDDCDGATDESFLFASDVHNCGMCGNDCGTGNDCCNGHCVDPATSDTNCGSCLNDCAGDSCCSTMCADTQTDPMNCGGCGVVCNGSQLCCAGSCIDPLRDANNCMGCGNRCNTGTSTACCGGVCHLPTATECTGCPVDCSTLTPAQDCCNNSCADRMTDEQNCGTCGHACTAGQFCCGGSCVASNESHCGSACATCVGELCCGNACVPVDSRHCHSCGLTCGTGTTCCTSGCFNISTDPAHCGDCNTACSGTTPACSNGHCCGAGTTWCGSSCINIHGNDIHNCGGCGVGCTGLNHCSNGACVLLG